MTYPMIPVFTPQGPTENTVAFGRRALSYLMETPNAHLLDNDALEAAQYIAAIVVRAPEMSEQVRETIQAIRLAVHRTIDARRAQEATRALLAQLQPDTKGPAGGSKVRAPKGPTGPTVPTLQFPETIDAF